MASALGVSRRTTRLLTSARSPHLRVYNVRQHVNRRHLFNFFKPKSETKEPTPVLAEDDLFRSFSQSPFQDIRARGEAIQRLAPCPVCATAQHHTREIPRAVKFECPDCGWPTHCSREHWEADEEHSRYCSRLREVNEDDHDLRRGRRMREFEMPGTLNMKANIMQDLIHIYIEQDLRHTRKRYHLPIGTPYGIPVDSLQWIQNGPAGMRARF
jgi:splicing suppressor protein 51